MTGPAASVVVTGFTVFFGVLFVGIVGGAAMLGDAVFTQTPVDSLTKIWRDDPSLNQYQNRYQPSVSITEDGALLNFTGTF